MTHHGMTRRRFLGGAATAAAASAGPFVWPRRARAAGKIVVRTIGGSYEEAVVKTIFDPFTKATGIEMVKVPATLGKLLAMYWVVSGFRPRRRGRNASSAPRSRCRRHVV